MKDLNEIRNEINRIDKQMAELFEARMNAVRLVAEYKMEHGIPVLDSSRENEVLARNTALITDTAIRSLYVNFLQNTMSLSRRYQQNMMDGLRIAYSGVEGAFAHIAAGRIFPIGQKISYPNFAATYDSVVRGECDCAVLPIENSFAGEVGQVQDLMFTGNLFINSIYDLQITQNLIGIPDTKIENIQKVVSHPQALAQCEGYIRSHGFSTEIAENTARAVKAVAESGDPHIAAIASRESAELYHLSILDHDINENATNTTRFAVFSRVNNETVHLKDSTFLLLFTVKNRAGSLAKAINVIGSYGFNMKVLRSRPMKVAAWEYYFYVEAEGDETSENARQMLQELAKYCDMLKVVGHYSTENDRKGGTQ